MSLPEQSEFFCRIGIHAGQGALGYIPYELDLLGSRKPFILSTEETSSRGGMKHVVGAFKNSGMRLSVLDKISETPDVNTVQEVKGLFHAGGCDAILAVGSGSLVDSAKMLNITGTVNTRGVDPLERPGTAIKERNPLFFIPASPGSGYETTGLACMGDKVLSSHSLAPDYAVIDPIMLEREPPLEVISSAMAALTHAAEIFISPSRIPWAESYGLTALKYLFNYLCPALNKQHWREARFALTKGEILAACAFYNTGGGTCHSLGNAISNYTPYSPGICMGIMLPYVLDYFSAQLDSAVPDLLIPMAGLERFTATAPHLRSGRVVRLLLELQFDLFRATEREFPLSLEEAGLSKDRLPDISKSCDETALINEKGKVMVLEYAWRGEPMSED
jgi:alcohol dehydrogenase